MFPTPRLSMSGEMGYNFLMTENKLTPMLKQYFSIKKKFPDTILFFRMGDFYEMFFEDAKIASPILEVVLTTRDKKKEDAVPMCGIPHHARNYYAAKLIKKGLKVAICEQVEDPAQAQNLVRREVTHILTPGTFVELEEDEQVNNYILSVFQQGDSISLASVDLAVADFEARFFSTHTMDSFASEIYRKYPREILCPESFKPRLQEILQRFPDRSRILINTFQDYEYNALECDQILKEQFGVSSLEGMGLADYPPAITAAGVLLKYLRSLRKGILSNITTLHFTPQEDYLIIDNTSLRNLEILKNLQTGSVKGSLFQVIDFTITPMGRRLLKKWISYPCRDPREINTRLSAVDAFYQNLIARSELRSLLRDFYDLAKLNTKISLNVALPSHLQKLAATLARIPDLKKILSEFPSGIPRRATKGLKPLKAVSDRIAAAIADQPGDNLSQGNYIRKGYHRELDELRALTKNAKGIISSMETRERDQTKIPSLKIRYNRVFGYFIDVTRTHLKLVPDHYIRKQTLVNSERFITDELKKLEQKILSAEERILELEKKLFQELIGEIQRYSGDLNQNSEWIARVDVVSAGGELAHKHRYVRPVINRGLKLDIREGRHPVVEATQEQGFIPNDTQLSNDRQQILLITGPNMGGKSTYLRQNALIVIMAQAGYFVPAKRASMGICDRVFTRIGASDALIEGKSTFLVEMIEAAVILNNATSRSLILLDEIGRGTSTYDGISIAWAVIEYLHDLPEKPKTLFATHYHELTELSRVLKRVKNYHITVKEWKNRVIFLHKIKEGPSDQSFGIHVAQIAGIPPAIIRRARGILKSLEKKEISRVLKERLIQKQITEAREPESPPLTESEVEFYREMMSELEKVEISNITPLQALNLLHYLKSESEKVHS